MVHTSTDQLPSDLQLLLNVNAGMIKVPKELPPIRPHDHHIPLLNESQSIKVKPYRYPTVQKNELEKMVAEMLDAGIIRDSHSSFASPVFLVKKRMAHGIFASITSN